MFTVIEENVSLIESLIEENKLTFDVVFDVVQIRNVVLGLLGVRRILLAVAFNRLD